MVPADRFCRRLDVWLDLSFVRDWTRQFYAERRRPSIDPIVFFELQLVIFFEVRANGDREDLVPRYNDAATTRVADTLVDDSIPCCQG